MTAKLEEDVKELFKSDMKTQEKIEDITNDVGSREFAESSLDVAEEVVSEVDEPRREKYVWTTVLQVGKVTGSDQLAEYAASKLQEWGEKHGPK